MFDFWQIWVIDWYDHSVGCKLYPYKFDDKRCIFLLSLISFLSYLWFILSICVQWFQYNSLFMSCRCSTALWIETFFFRISSINLGVHAGFFFFCCKVNIRLFNVLKDLKKMISFLNLILSHIMNGCIIKMHIFLIISCTVLKKFVVILTSD